MYIQIQCIDDSVIIKNMDELVDVYLWVQSLPNHSGVSVRWEAQLASLHTGKCV